MISNLDLKGAAVPAPVVTGVGGRRAALEVDLAHHLPGRLRLRSAVFKGNGHASEEAQRHFAQIGGVTSATVNPTTGSVLVEYDPAVIPPSKVADVLATHGFFLRVIDEDTETGTGWADKLGSAVKDWVINALAERLALAVIGALV